MAQVSPLQAVHYDLGKVALAEVVAPPYDVIDDAQRAELAARSPYNVVELDLPRDPEGGDPYEHAAELLKEWTDEGVLAGDPDPTMWALEQDYSAARRLSPDPPRLPRPRQAGTATARASARTSGPSPARRRIGCGSPAPRDTTSPPSSPSIPATPGATSSPRSLSDPWGEVTDDDGTTHRIWRIGDPAIHEAIAIELARAELLIADGHHRYETSLAYQREVGPGGPADYVLMALVSLEDPGLTVFPTHRLIAGLADDPAKQETLGTGLKELFDVEEVSPEQLDPLGNRRDRRLRLHRLPVQAPLPAAAQGDRAPRGDARRTAPPHTGGSTQRSWRSWS